jgi:hypothetical protein
MLESSQQNKGEKIMNEQTNTVVTEAPKEVKRGRGRPKGSKNKVKVVSQTAPVVDHSAQA